jgi:hypothetical protein
MFISAFDSLEKFAKKTNRPIEKFENVIPATAFNKLSRSKRWVTIKDSKGAFYFGYDNSGAELTQYAYFAGIALPIKIIMQKFTLKLDPKDVLDRINIFKKFQKTYNKELDKYFVFETGDIRTAAMIFEDKSVKQLIGNLFKDQSYSLEINRINFPGIPHLKGKNLLCIHKNEWIFDEYTIESLFKLIYQIKDRLAVLKICE